MQMMKGCTSHKLSWVLVMIGGLNWGLVGLGTILGGDWNVVGRLLSAWPTTEAVVYILVGIAALMQIVGCRCKKCKAEMEMCNSTGKM